MKDSISTKLELLDNLHGSDESASILKVMLLDLLGKEAAFKLEYLTTEETIKFETALQRVLNDEPVQYITGKSWFYGLEFFVDQRVLIPRPETEELVEIAIDFAKKYGYKNVLDIGTGSGCIAVTIKKNLPVLGVSAMDVSKEALEVTRINSNFHKTEIQLFEDNILDPKEHFEIKFDLIISNPPYIEHWESDRMSASTLKYEPELALFSDNALQFYRAILEFSKIHLSANGAILMECNEFFANEILDLAIHMGYSSAKLQKDIQGKNRMLVIKMLEIK